VASETVITTSGDREQSEGPTERATLQIRTSPFDIKVSAQGAVAWSLSLGVIGPAVTIAAGFFVGFPAWAVIVIAALQILAAALQRRRE
jgi:glycerol uptake facilitator-like aquaporin